MDPSIQCVGCERSNMPLPTVKGVGHMDQIQAVLAGKFRTCKHCGRLWLEIYIPYRPMVREALKTVEKLPPYVIIFGYTGYPPQAFGN